MINVCCRCRYISYIPDEGEGGAKIDFYITKRGNICPHFFFILSPYLSPLSLIFSITHSLSFLSLKPISLSYSMLCLLLILFLPFSPYLSPLSLSSSLYLFLCWNVPEKMTHCHHSSVLNQNFEFPRSSINRAAH